jgi:hypothetical protein
MLEKRFTLSNNVGKAELQMRATADCAHAKRAEARFIICDAEIATTWHLRSEPQTVEQYRLLHYVGGQGLN